MTLEITPAVRRQVLGYNAVFNGASNPRGLLSTLTKFYEEDTSTNVNECPGTRLLLCQIFFLINGTEQYNKLAEDMVECKVVVDQFEGYHVH